jgi:Flp pilus assembly protein TadG
MKLQEVKMSRGGWARILLGTDDDSGQALVEVAVSAMFLILLLTAVCECGILEYDAIEVTNAARAGVQYGAQSRTTSADISGMQAAALADGSNVSGLKATATHFCSCSDGSASTCSGGDCSASHIVEYVQVNTAVTVTTPFHIPALPRSFNLTGLAVMRAGQ